MQKLEVCGKQNAILHKENLEGLEALGIEKELQAQLRKMLHDFYHPRFDFKKMLEKARYHLLEAVNKIRLFDFFYTKDRIYKTKVSMELGLRKLLRGIKPEKRDADKEIIAHKSF